MTNHIKGTIRDLLSFFGYELWAEPLNPTRRGVRKRRRIGKNHFADIRRILGRDALVILDVGGHFGESVLEFCRWFSNANIHSFEPDPDSYRTLCNNTRSLRRVRCANVALGEACGTAKLHRNGFDATNSLLRTSEQSSRYIDPALLKTNSLSVVDVTTIDRYLEDNGIDGVDVLKIDAQGFELRVLMGAERALRSGSIRLIYLEVMFVHLYDGQAEFDEINRHLANFGYRLVAFYDFGYENGDFIVAANALFVRESNDSVQKASH